MTISQENKSLIIKQELLWIGIILILCTMIFVPLISNQIKFPFTAYNLIYIAVFVYYTRLIFLLRHSIFAKAFVVKLILIFTAIPIIVLLMDGLAEFQAFLDEEGLQSIMTHLPIGRQNTLIQFIKNEFIFFGVGAVVTAIIMPIRMIISIWRVRNRGTV